jgi:hypothetical protein
MPSVLVFVPLNVNSPAPALVSMKDPVTFPLNVTEL